MKEITIDELIMQLEELTNKLNTEKHIYTTYTDTVWTFSSSKGNKKSILITTEVIVITIVFWDDTYIISFYQDDKKTEKAAREALEGNSFSPLARSRNLALLHTINES